MATRYSWAITRDLIAEPGEPEGTLQNAKGMIGPFEVEMTFEAILAHPDRRLFRLRDGDGEVYYEGYFVGDEDDEMAPLDDFGTPNAGAVEIQYYVGDRWVSV